MELISAGKTSNTTKTWITYKLQSLLPEMPMIIRGEEGEEA